MEKTELIEKPEHEKTVQAARAISKTLQQLVKELNLTKKVAGKDYLIFEGWQVLGKFFKQTVGIAWSRPIEEKGVVLGYEAKATVLDENGVMVGSAEAMCLKNEDNWKNKPDFQLRSMAQTRASAKALRNLHGWVVVMAGLPETPAEEIQTEEIKKAGTGGPSLLTPKCSSCKSLISAAVSKYSKQKYNKELCLECQNAA